jgi:hypothetical protein
MTDTYRLKFDNSRQSWNVYYIKSDSLLHSEVYNWCKNNLTEGTWTWWGGWFYFIDADCDVVALRLKFKEL